MTKLLDDVVAKARARALAAYEEAQKAEASKKASQVETWKSQIRERDEAERASRNKAGLDIAEEFLKEIAGPFARFASRDDAAKLANIEILLRPGKSSDSASFSIQMKSPGSSPRIWHRASIENLDSTQQAMMSRLHQKGGLVSTTPIEMMQEIVKLRETLMQLNKLSQASPEEAAASLAKIKDVIGTLHLPNDDDVSSDDASNAGA